MTTYTREQLKTLDRPSDASKMKCFLCGTRIGDREYQCDADGLPFHYECPTAAEIEAKVDADMKAAARRRLLPDPQMEGKPATVTAWVWLDDHNYPDLKLWQNCLIAAANAGATCETTTAQKMYARMAGGH